MEKNLIFFGISDTGLKRKNNEDHFIVADLNRKLIGVEDNTVFSNLICHNIGEKGTVLAVADGLGGHENGDIASAIAVESTIKSLFAIPTDTPIKKRLSLAIERAHYDIKNKSLSMQNCQKMCSTLTIAHIDKTTMTIAQIGDSRAYSYNNGKLVRLTEDQTLISALVNNGVLTEEQSKNHPSKHIVLQALGQEEDIVPTFYSSQLKPNSYILLCTDGLSSYVCDDTIEMILSSGEDENLLCQRLINCANDAGGIDNITVLIASLKG